MNQIKLQNLTPHIYYNHSRDFQLIGRLYDIVLNSVKTNVELLYNLPFNDSSDKQLIDLLAMTIGFKSRHNYNIKQLSALCSAFAQIIRNKGNIQSIELAIKALLNAEGISEGFDYEFTKNNTSITLYIPQTLSDLNLLRDLLVYIIPAGMSCNIARETRITQESTTKLTTNDDVTIYNGTYLNSNTQTVIPVNSNASATLADINNLTNELVDGFAKATPGLIAHGSVLALDENEALSYNIVYITNGGKLQTNSNTKFSYDQNTKEVKLPQVEKENYTFVGWKDSNGKEFNMDASLTSDYLNSQSGNIVLTAQYSKENN